MNATRVAHPFEHLHTQTLPAPLHARAQFFDQNTHKGGMEQFAVALAALGYDNSCESIAALAKTINSEAERGSIPGTAKTSKVGLPAGLAALFAPPT